MKTWGWILIILGTLSLIGQLSKGTFSLYTLILPVLGAYLISRANKKAKEKDEKNNWTNN